MKLDRNIRQSRAEEKVLGGENVAHLSIGGNAQQLGGQRFPWSNNGGRSSFLWQPRGTWRGGAGQGNSNQQRLTGAETGQERVAVNWTTRRAQVVCYKCGKKRHYLADCKEADRIRIAELKEALKGSRGQ